MQCLHCVRAVLPCGGGLRSLTLFGLGMLLLACARRGATHDLHLRERYLVKRALLHERRCPRRVVLLTPSSVHENKGQIKGKASRRYHGGITPLCARALGLALPARQPHVRHHEGPARRSSDSCPCLPAFARLCPSLSAPVPLASPSRMPYTIARRATTCIQPNHLGTIRPSGRRPPRPGHA
jgi:hypothetical protein